MIQLSAKNVWQWRLGVCLGVGLAAAVSMAIYTLFMPDYYRSQAKILPSETKMAGGFGQLAAAIGVGLPGQDGGDANHVDILASRTLREMVINSVYSFKVAKNKFSAPVSCNSTLYDYWNPTHSSKWNMEKAIAKLGPVLGSSRDTRSKMIEITAETESPDLSQQIVLNASAFLEKILNNHVKTHAGNKAAYADARLQEAMADSRAQEEKLANFLGVNRNYQTTFDPRVKLQGARLEAEFKLQQQLIQTLSINREQALLEAKNDMPVLTILDPASLPIAKSRPNRSLMVLISFILGACGSCCFFNRRWLVEAIRESEKRAVVHEVTV